MMRRGLVLGCILCFLLTICAYAQSESGNEQLIEQAIQKMHKKEHTVSLEMLVEAKSIAEQKNWPKQNFRATNNIGANYYMLQEFGEALNYYLEAYEIAVENHDNSNVMTVLNNISILYFQEKNMEKASEYFLKAYELADKSNESFKKALYAINLGFVLNKLDRLDEAKKYIDEAFPLIKKNPEILLMAQLARAENNLFQNNLEESLKESTEILKNLAQKDADNRIFMYLVMAQIYQRKGDYKEALLYNQKAIDESPNIQLKLDSYQLIAQIYADSKQFENSIRYKDSVILAKDSLMISRNSNLYENGKIKFEIQNYQYELRESQREVQASKNLLYTIGIASLMLLLVTGWAFRNYHIKHQQQKKIAELERNKERSESLIRERQLREKEALALLEQERLEIELEHKNRKLTAKEVRQSSRNELIEEVIKLLTQQPEVSRNEDLSKYTRELKNHLKQDTQWDSFFTHFEEINQGFLDRLKIKHPNLISSEVRFIIYVYMNLSNKEISSLLNITPQSCRKRKERISKKLNPPEGTLLYSYLSTI